MLVIGHFLVHCRADGHLLFHSKWFDDFTDSMSALHVNIKLSLSGYLTVIRDRTVKGK